MIFIPIFILKVNFELDILSGPCYVLMNREDRHMNQVDVVEIDREGPASLVRQSDSDKMWQSRDLRVLDKPENIDRLRNARFHHFRKVRIVIYVDNRHISSPSRHNLERKCSSSISE